jgi:pimeloyl-ACP methyl ester carboxylesterase
MTNAQTIDADTLAPHIFGAGEPLLCLGFAEPANSALLQQLSASRQIFATPAHSAAAALQTPATAKFTVLAKSSEIGAALALAAAHPDEIEALVLLAPSKAAFEENSDRLAEAKVQILVLAGTLDAEGGEAATAFKQKLRACHLVYVYDAGRDMDTERPEAVAKVTRDFLTRRDKFLVSNSDGRITA